MDEYECYWCSRNAIAIFGPVPEHLHPDERVVVCSECGTFMRDVLKDIDVCFYVGVPRIS